MQHFAELIQFFWKKIHWKVGHILHAHNQGEVLWMIFKLSISWHVVEMFAILKGDQRLCLPDELYHFMCSLDDIYYLEESQMILI